MATIRLLLADDHQMFLESMSMLLSTISDFQVMATATNGREVLSFLEQHPVDVLICDLRMPLMSGIETMTEISVKHPAVRTLVLSTMDDANSIRHAIQAGASGYLLKTSGKTDLENAIRAIAAGQTFFSNGIMMILTSRTENNPSSPLQVSLSDREMEILRLIVSENSSTQIAEKLFISFNTVETHRKNLYKKLGVNTSLGLLKYALKLGLVE